MCEIEMMERQEEKIENFVQGWWLKFSSWEILSCCAGKQMRVTLNKESSNFWKCFP